MSILLERLELRGNLLVLSATAFALGVVSYTWWAVLPLHMHDLGADDVQIATVYAAFAIVSALSQFPGGWLADRLGRRAMIVAGNVGVVGGLLIAAAARSWPAVAAGIVIHQGVGGLQWPSFLALMGESTRRRGRAYSSFYLSWATGIVIGPLLGAALIPRAGVPALIAATALTNLLVAAVRWHALEEAAWRPGGRLDWSQLLRPAVVRTIATGALAEGIAALTVFGPFVALYAGQVAARTKPEVNVLIATGTAASIAAALVLGGLPDRLSPRRVVAAAYALHAALLAVWAWTGVPWWSALVLAAAYAAQTVGSSAYNTLKMDAAGDETRGTAMGAIGTVTASGSAAAPLLAGAALAPVGPAAPFLLALVLALAIGVVQSGGRRAA